MSENAFSEAAALLRKTLEDHGIALDSPAETIKSALKDTWFSQVGWREQDNIIAIMQQQRK